MNFLLAGDVFNNLIDILMKTNVVVALILAAVGITVAIMAKRVSLAIKKTKNVEEAESLILIFKAIGLVMIVIALVLILLP